MRLTKHQGYLGIDSIAGDLAVVDLRFEILDVVDLMPRTDVTAFATASTAASSQLFGDSARISMASNMFDILA